MKHFVKITALITVLLLLSFCRQREISKELSLTSVMPEIQKDTCDDPDASIKCCFVNMPKQISSTMIIPDEKKNGEKMLITGTVYKKKKPYPDVIIYAYHTDAKGEYSKKGNEKGFQKWHGSHHGWCKTDKNGNYRIETIRPASYPKTSNPAHIHSAIKVPDNSLPFYINDFLFKDDPLVTQQHLSRARERGGSGVMDVKKVDNVWIGKRDIFLE